MQTSLFELTDSGFDDGVKAALAVKHCCQGRKRKLSFCKLSSGRCGCLANARDGGDEERYLQPPL